MSGKFSMDDYIDVAERIAEFNKRYPDGTLQTVDWTDVRIGEQTFIVYRAAAYRTPDDPRPGHGIAWEPFPGKTPYTKDSELMNAETSAWGRAIVACGLTSNRKIASLQEVQNRQPAENGNGNHQPTAAEPKPSERAASAKQRGEIESEARKAKVSPGDLANIIVQAAGEEPREWRSPEHAEQTLDRLLDRLPARLVDAVLDAVKVPF